jgi:hypothetical protein
MICLSVLSVRAGVLSCACVRVRVYVHAYVGFVVELYPWRPWQVCC